MAETITQLLSLRDAGPSDCRLIWQYRNDAGARQGSFNTEPIIYSDHERWFAEHIDDPRTKLLIIVDPVGLDIGYVRFDISLNEVHISICLDPAARGKRFGSEAIRQGCEQMAMIDTAKRIVAQVRRDNPASISAFRQAGFQSKSNIMVNNILGLEMEYAGQEANRLPLTD